MNSFRLCCVASRWEDKRIDVRKFAMYKENIDRARNAQPFHRRHSPQQEVLIERLRQHYCSFADNFEDHLIRIELHQLVDFNLNSDSRIQVPLLKSGIYDDEAHVCVDFANKTLGGGYLTYGLAQEEVMFLERLDIGFFVAKKYAEGMPLNIGPDEAMTISGGYQFSALDFYGRIPYDYLLRMSLYSEPKPKATVIAIDCLRPNFQKYKEEDLLWILRKAYVGFQAVSEEDISTGHWGGGVFLNNKSVIFCIQTLAATLAGKRLKYYCCGQPCAEGLQLVEKWHREQISVRDAFAELVKLCKTDDDFATAWKPNIDTWARTTNIPGQSKL